MNLDYRKRFRSDINLAQIVIREALDKVDGDINTDNMFDLRLILSELVCNSIIHGNKHNSERYVNLYLHIDNKNIEIEVSDEGEGITQDIVYNPEELKPNGRGLILVKGLTDFFQVNGSTVKVTKKLAWF